MTPPIGQVEGSTPVPRLLHSRRRLAGVDPSCGGAVFMQLNGRRRVRSGYPGSVHPPVPLPPPPQPPKAGVKSVRWRDHQIHLQRGFSSCLDLELTQCKSELTQCANGKIIQLAESGETIEAADLLWFSHADYNEARNVVKSEFFRRLGEESDGAENIADDVEWASSPNWNKLTAYHACQPRKFSRAADNGSTSPPDEDGRRSSDISGSDAEEDRVFKRDNGFRRVSTENRISPTCEARESPFGGVDTYRPTPMRGTALKTPVGLDHFTVHGLVGEGAFGKVMMATKIDTGKVYAVKVIRKALLFSCETRVTQVGGRREEVVGRR